MAAPKHWGYTRDQAVEDELVVSWADGDLTANVAKELEERLLSSQQDRASVAVFARDAARTTEAHGAREALLEPRAALIERCQELGADPDVQPLPAPVASRWALPQPQTMLGVTVGALLTLFVIFWMWRNFR